MLGSELIDLAFAFVLAAFIVLKYVKGVGPPKKAVGLMLGGWATVVGGRFLALMVGLTGKPADPSVAAIVIWTLFATAGAVCFIAGMYVALTGEMPFARSSAEAQPASPPPPAPAPPPAAQGAPAPPVQRAPAPPQGQGPPGGPPRRG